VFKSSRPSGVLTVKFTSDYVAFKIKAVSGEKYQATISNDDLGNYVDERALTVKDLRGWLHDGHNRKDRCSLTFGTCEGGFMKGEMLLELYEPRSRRSPPYTFKLYLDKPTPASSMGDWMAPRDDDWELSLSSESQISMTKSALLDPNPLTGVATNPRENSFIKVSFPEPVAVTGVVLGNPRRFLKMDKCDDIEDVDFQFSVDGKHWIRHLRLDLTSDSISDAEYFDCVGIKAQHFRFYSSQKQSVALSYLKFFLA